jgi:hypothetical protein
MGHENETSVEEIGHCRPQNVLRQISKIVKENGESCIFQQNSTEKSNFVKQMTFHFPDQILTFLKLTLILHLNLEIDDHGQPFLLSLDLLSLDISVTLKQNTDY